jgi:hypothetical protein
MRGTPSRQEAPHLVACEHDAQGQALRGTRHALDPLELASEDGAIQKQDRVQGLVVRRRRHLAGTGQRREERGDLGFRHVVRVALAVEEDEAATPCDVRLLGPRAQVP